MRTTPNNDIARLNIVIPQKLMSEMRKEVPPRGKSKFIAEAVDEKLSRLKRERAFRELAKLPPTFTNISDGGEYIHKMRRAEAEAREERLGT